MNKPQEASSGQRASAPWWTFGHVWLVIAGPVIVITYRGNSAPNPVTGKTGTDVFERYDYWRSGHEVILTLSGPAGADTVDPWRTITDSLRWT